MGMRSVLAVNLRVGPLLGIPLKIYKACDDPSQGISFRQVHAPCSTPIRRPAFCPTCEETIDTDMSPGSIRKAYPLSESQMVVLDDVELKSLKPERDGLMSVETYLDSADVDPTFFEGGVYYLSPDGRDTTAFVTFRDALSGRYAVAKIVMYQRERLVAIRAKGRLLAMHYLRTAAEVRDEMDVPGADTVPLQARPEHVALMRQLIDAQAPVAFEDVTIKQDRYIVALKGFLAQKLAGLTPQPVFGEAPPPPAPAADLTAQLLASLAASEAA